MDDDGEDRAGGSLRAALRKDKAVGCASEKTAAGGGAIQTPLRIFRAENP